MDDRIDANAVEFTVDETGKVWVNVDGKCVLRIGHAKHVIADDPVRGLDVVYQDAPKHRETGLEA